MIDKLSALKQRYREVLRRLAGEMQLPEPAVAKIIGDLDRASRGVLNLRGVFADRRINQALDEIADIAQEYHVLFRRTLSKTAGNRLSHTKLLLR